MLLHSGKVARWLSGTKIGLDTDFTKSDEKGCNFLQ
jgi:hypothetical protein